MALIPGPQLFLLFRDSPLGPAHVSEYKTTAPDELPTHFLGAINPVALAVGGNRMFVLDKGDTAAARTTVCDTCVVEYLADCGPLRGFKRPITDVSKYWHLREYLLDGTLLSTFTDTSFASVNGVAADASGNVYISGVVIVCVVWPFDNRIRSMDSEFRIRRYGRGGSGSYVIGPWHRDPTWEVIQGTGIGSTRNPQGLFWANQGGESVYFADAGNNEVQKYDPLSLLNSFKINWGGVGADSLLLSHPSDVAVDKAGFVYLVDDGNHRVLRYDPEGNYIQRVDIEPSVGGDFLVSPTAVAADVDQVYVADTGLGVIARFRRRK